MYGLRRREGAKRLQDPDVHERFLRAVPLTAEWLDRADPISGMFVMAGLSNRRRRLVAGERPPTPGLALVGDASLYTNPALGQGVSLTFWMAQRLAGAVERVADDPAGVATAYEAWVADELLPRYERQLVADRGSLRQLEAGIAGQGFLPPADEDDARRFAIQVLASQDEEVALFGARVGHLLSRPDVYRNEPSIAAKVQAFLDAAPEGPPPGAGPLPRNEFEALVTG